jgi:GAF domain-containing protein
MEEANSPEVALGEGLDGVTNLVTQPYALESTLAQIAHFAVVATPGAEGAGLTLVETDSTQTVVATDDFVREVDDIQYALNEGPCVSAVAQGRTFMSGNLGGEPRWPRFGPRVGRLGVHSALSVPLRSQERILGAINIYARPRNAFGQVSVDMAEAFGPQAAVSAANAQVLARAERLIGQLQEALTSRSEIDHAIGILISRGGITASEAMNRLRAMSQFRSVKVSELAHSLVTEAMRSAQARARPRTETDP